MPRPDERVRRIAGTPRSFTAWALAHGLQRAMIQRGARKGDLISRMVTDPALREDPFPAYEPAAGARADRGEPVHLRQRRPRRVQRGAAQ
ncbi:hypothetical protein [Nocardioides convexus]|uniref:hypothetical protein n=1 Tax=Nocardioides convexus TaxID=2712224 RepID=UPI00241896EC|nr:hypothetical protein [Nocardioides convexus]